MKEKGIKKSYCAGCREENKKCAFLKQRCKLLLNKKIEYCFQCKDFPCERLQRLDKRYRVHYRTSMIDNLKFIKKNGISKFLKEEEKKWKCKRCGGLICCHNGLCFRCDLVKLKRKKRRYRWEDD